MNFHNALKKSAAAFFIFLIVCAALPFPADAEEPAVVALVPFKINAAKDLTYLQDGIFDMLATRLAWEEKVTVLPKAKTVAALSSVTQPLTENSARGLGGALSADFVLYGSLTVFGESMSLDAKMVDVRGDRPTMAFYNQSATMEDVIPGINTFAEDINRKIFGKEPVAVQAAGPAPPARETGIYSHPEKMLEGGFAPEGDSGGSSPFIMSRGSGEGGGFWKSQTIRAELVGLAVGDVDGDGKNETIMVDPHDVLIYRMESGRFVRVARIEGDVYKRNLAVDVIDVREGTLPEIYVTCLNTSSQSLNSFVLEYNGSDYKRTADDLNWYFRAVKHPIRGPLLLGQKKGVKELFTQGIHELQWTPAGLDSAGRAPLPKDVNVFGVNFADFTGTGLDSVIFIGDDDRLRMLSSGGEREWKSEDRFGGSENYIEAPSALDREVINRLYLPQRTIVTDMDKNGALEVVLIKSDSAVGRTFEKFRKYSSGEFYSLSWDGLGFSTNWHTRKVSGYFADFTIADMTNDGAPDLVAAVVRERDSVVSKPKSAIISYDLSSMMKNGQ